MRLVKFFFMFVCAVVGGIVFIPLLGGHGASELRQLFNFSGGVQLVRRQSPPEEVYLPIDTLEKRAASVDNFDDVLVDSSFVDELENDEIFVESARSSHEQKKLEEQILDLQIETSKKDREIIALRERIESLESLPKTERVLTSDGSYEQSQAINMKRILENAQDKLITELVQKRQQNRELSEQVQALMKREGELQAEILDYQEKSSQSPSQEDIQELKTAYQKLQSSSQAERLELRKKITELDSSLTERDDAITKLKAYKLQAEKSVAKMEQLLAEKESEASKLKLEIAKLGDTLAAKESEIALAKAETASVGEEATLVRGQLEKQLTQAGESLQACRSDLQRNLAIAEEVPTLRKEITELEGQKLILETELAQLGGAKPRATRRTRATAALNTPPITRVPVTPPRVPATGYDMRTVTVVVDKAVLRLGPGSEMGQAMTVGQGTQLTVEETHGEWYRVIAPNGKRLFIRQDLVRDPSQVTTRRAPKRQAPAMAPRYNSARNGFGVKTDKADASADAFEALRRQLGAK